VTGYKNILGTRLVVDEVDDPIVALADTDNFILSDTGCSYLETEIDRLWRFTDKTPRWQQVLLSSIPSTALPSADGAADGLCSEDVPGVVLLSIS
jgi:hypothetical protein